MVYDAADTAYTFQLSDGTVGAISYTIPWQLVDATQANQSVPLTALNLNIAGQNFAYGVANFTVAPTIQLQYGHATNVIFSLDTSAVPGFAYSSFAVSVDGGGNNIVNAVKVGVGALAPSFVRAGGTGTLTIDFSTIDTTAGFTASMRVTFANNTTAMVQVTIGAGATKVQVRNAFEAALKNAGVTAGADDTTGLRIEGNATTNLKKVEVFGFGTKPPKFATSTKGQDNIEPTYVTNP